MSYATATPFAPADLLPQASALALKHATLLRSLPPVLAASLLTQIRGYDWQFPAERRELEAQLQYLSEPQTAQTQRILAAFRALPVESSNVTSAWTAPEASLQSFTAHLWQVHAVDQFRACGEDYGSILAAVRERNASSANRLVIVLVGQGARETRTPLFRKLRQHGTFFSNVDRTHLMEEATAILSQRASTSNKTYDHWLIDGGAAGEQTASHYASLSFDALQPVLDSLATCVKNALGREHMGPEKVRSYMMALQPAALHGFPSGQDEMMRHFATRVLCDGSGTQNLSTSFVQWAVREALRRAQPATLLARFAPRSRNVDFLDEHAVQSGLDADGALVDADMGAYYTWLNLQRVPGTGQRSFLVAAENGQGAVAIGPGMAAEATATNAVTLHNIVRWMEA
jgi:hypothetical protein